MLHLLLKIYPEMTTKHADFVCKKCSHTPFECLHKPESSFNHSHMYTLSATVGRAVTEAHIRLKRERGTEGGRGGAGGCITEKDTL